MRNTILSLTQKQLSGKTIGEFYDLIGILLHIEGKVKYDCRKILVSNNIKDLPFITIFPLYLPELKIVPIFSFVHSIEMFAIIFNFFFFFNKYSSKFSFVNSKSMPSG